MIKKITISYNDKEYEIIIDKINIITGNNKNTNEFIKNVSEDFDNISIIDKAGTMISNMNIITNLSLPLLYHTNIQEKIIHEKVRNIAKNLDLNYNLFDFPENLTIEDKKKLSVVRALLTDPELIVINEISNINIYSLNKLFENLLTFSKFIVCSTVMHNIYVSLNNINIIDL